MTPYRTRGYGSRRGSDVRLLLFDRCVYVLCHLGVVSVRADGNPFRYERQVRNSEAQRVLVYPWFALQGRQR